MKTLAIVALWAVSSCATAGFQQDYSCAFINKNAYNNQAECTFADKYHNAVFVTPSKKISVKTAYDWLIATSTWLQLGGEKRFKSITVATSPNITGKYVTAENSEKATVLQEPAIIKTLTKVCIRPNDWSDVTAIDGTPGTPHKCSPYK